MPELNNHQRNTIGNLFDQIGSLAIKGEVATENKEATKEELRAFVQKIMDRTHFLQQLLQ